MTDEIFNAGFELKFLGNTGVFEGYASVFNVTDSMNDDIAPGAFADSLAQFQRENRLPPMLWQHNAEEPIGAWQEMREDAHGLYVKGVLLVNDIPLAKEAYALLKEKVVSGLSIGFRTKASRRDPKTGVRVLTKIDLLEVSLVTFPANTDARVTSVKTLFSGGAAPSMRAFEAFLRASGFSRKQAKGIVAQGYKAIATPEADAVSLLRESLRAETLKIRCEVLERKYVALEFNVDQPRVPASSSGGGQWTSGDDAGLDPGIANPTWSPLNFIGGLFQGAWDAVASDIGRSLVSIFGGEAEASSAIGAADLSGAQAQNLARFSASMPKNATSASITSLSDGSKIFAADSPARNIPGSFARYEKIIDASGKQ